jgi:hypothetical protein
MSKAILYSKSSPPTSQRLLLPELSPPKKFLSPSVSKQALSTNNSGAKRLFLRVPQRDLQSWQETLEKLNKEELNTKRNLKEINARYNFLMQRFHEKEFDNETPEDKKQKQLERSILLIDGLLRTLKKKKGVDNKGG